MHDLKSQIETLKKEFTSTLQQVKSPAQLEQLRIAYLGRNGSISALMGRLKDLSVEEKR